jgi:NAD(P)-dependent dehydrogenase (short-subunit alcohol dehydrogenase family)
VSGLLAGKVAIVTGAGHGIGRGHALELAREGAAVVVNDIGATVDGRATESADAARVVAELIRSRGGSAVADHSDVGDWEAAGRLVEHAVSEFGRLDVLVNNAGIQRKGGILDATTDDWDSVMRVHLRGTFNCLQHAARYWRDADEPVSASVINTTSPTSLVNVMSGILAYVAAKGGIAALTRAVAVELEPLGVRVNAISPTGLTRMTDFFFGSERHKEPDAFYAFDAADPSLNAPLVAWLASDAAASVTGQIFESRGGRVVQILPWREGPAVAVEERHDPAQLGAGLLRAMA